MTYPKKNEDNRKADKVKTATKFTINRQEAKASVVSGKAEKLIRIGTERGRHQQPQINQKPSPTSSTSAGTAFERGRLATNKPVTNEKPTSRDDSAEKHKKSARMTADPDLTHSERERHAHSHPNAAAKRSIKAKSKKKPVGVKGLLKSSMRPVARPTASNKHVVPKPIHSNLMDTDIEIEYDDEELVDKPRSTVQGNTNLAAPISPPPFLTKKSSTTPVVGRAFCDKLSITWDPENKDVEGWLLKAQLLSKPHNDHYVLSPLPQRPKDLYRYSYALKNQDGNQVVLIQFGPKNSKMNLVRIEYNPAEIGAKGLSEMQRVLKGLFGPDFRNDLIEGNLTRLDATVDIKKARPDDVMIYSDRARNSGLWTRSFNQAGQEKWSTETMTLGSQTSDYFAEVYDKSAQLWRVKGQTVDELITRIEVRFTPRDKNAASMRVKDILQIKNPFAPINISYYPAPEDGDFHFKFFICAARWYGAERALGMIKDRNIRSRYWNLLLDYQPDWWQPEKLWKQFLDDLRATGLFPDEIF